MHDRLGELVAAGAKIRTLRTTIGWSQRELGRRAKVAQSMISAVESGRRPRVTIATAVRLVEAMGAHLTVTVDAPYLGDRARQRDPAHARLSSYVVGQLRRAGWDARSEVEVGGDRSRGWIDVLAYHPPRRLMLVLELKTEIHDLGQIERTLGWYERASWSASRRFGWSPLRSIGVLLLLATAANDRRVRANHGEIALGFPRRARHLAGVLGDGPTPTEPGRAIAMIDPRSRRRIWYRSLQVDGRRSPAPYADYAEFMRMLSPSAPPRTAPRDRARTRVGSDGSRT